jgi:hypothetical protein
MKSFLNVFLIIFAPEEAEIFKDYLFILMSIDCTSGNYRDKTSHNKQIYTLKKNLLKFENEFVDIKNQT